MARPPIAITVRPSWAHALRTGIYDALYTVHRGYWLVRFAFALGINIAGHVAYGAICAAACQPDMRALEVVILLLPVCWFAYPFARRPLAAPQTVTFLDEGFSVESEKDSLSVAWTAVRGVRRTLWDLVLVLDGATVSLPLRVLPAGTVDGVLDRLSGPAEAGTEPDARPRLPYRTPDARAAGPEDEEASPREWFAPASYPEAVLAFPTAGDQLRGLLTLKRGAFFMPAVLLVLAALLALLGTKGGGDMQGELIRFTSVATVVAVIAVGSLVVDFSPALFALRDRAVRDREAGVLYAIGKLGLYVRTQHFERRESWERVYIARSGARGVALFTVSGLHVIPVSSFQTDVARDTFVTLLESEIAKRPRIIYS